MPSRRDWGLASSRFLSNPTIGKDRILQFIWHPSGAEGIYRSNTDEEDVLIDVFNTETPDALLKDYKSEYKDANYNPFNETSINGHNATQVKYYITKNGTQTPKYILVWTTKNSMIKVGGSVDPQKVIDLATATNS